MNPFTIEIIMGIFGAIGAGQLIPAIVRIHRRKSSDDFSLWSMGIGISSQTIWLIYALWKPILSMTIAGVSWLILLTILLLSILKYRKDND